MSHGIDSFTNREIRRNDRRFGNFAHHISSFHRDHTANGTAGVTPAVITFGKTVLVQQYHGERITENQQRSRGRRRSQIERTRLFGDSHFQNVITHFRQS